MNGKQTKNAKCIVALSSAMVLATISMTTQAEPDKTAFNSLSFQDLVDCGTSTKKLATAKQTDTFFKALFELRKHEDDPENNDFLPLDKLPAQANIAKVIDVKRFPDRKYSQPNQHIVLYQLKHPVRILDNKTHFVMVSHDIKEYTFYKHLSANRYEVMALFPTQSPDNAAEKAIEYAQKLGLPIIYDLPSRVLAEKLVFGHHLTDTYTHDGKTYTEKFTLAAKQQFKYYPYKYPDRRKSNMMSASRFLINTYKTQKLPALNPEAMIQIGCTYAQAYDVYGKHSPESLNIQPADILNGIEWVK